MPQPFDVDVLHERARKFVPVTRWVLPVTVEEYAYLLERGVLKYKETGSGGRWPHLWTWELAISPTYDLFGWALARQLEKPA